MLMGRNNTMARDHTLRCFGRTLSHGEVSTPLPSIPTSVLHMMVETTLKLAMLRMTLILVKTEISRPAQVRQFQIMVFAWFGKKAMYKIKNSGYFHGCLNLRVPFILDHGAAESSKCFLSEGKHYALLSTAKCRPHCQRRSLNRIRDVGCWLAGEAPDPSRSVHRVG